MNRHIRTFIVAPMTTASRPYPTRVPIQFQGQRGQVALDQVRTIDKSQLVRRLGRARKETSQTISAILVEMFAYDPG